MQHLLIRIPLHTNSATSVAVSGLSVTPEVYNFFVPGDISPGLRAARDTAALHVRRMDVARPRQPRRTESRPARRMTEALHSGPRRAPQAAVRIHLRSRAITTEQQSTRCHMHSMATWHARLGRLHCENNPCQKLQCSPRMQGSAAWPCYTEKRLIVGDLIYCFPRRCQAFGAFSVLHRKSLASP